jgi:hypothetical protein
MKNYTEKEGAHRARNLFSGVVPLMLGIGLLLASCKDFYSTSLGEPFARDPSNVKVTRSNVYDLLKDANGDIEASREILKKLKGTDDPVLQAAAVKAATQAAGLTELAVSNLGVLTGANASNGASLENLARMILAAVTKNDIRGIAADIAATVNGPALDQVPTSDLTLLLVTLMLAEVPDTDAGADPFGDYADTWGSEKKIDGSGTVPLDKNEEVIALVANVVISRPDSALGKMVKSLVGEK